MNNDHEMRGAAIIIAAALIGVVCITGGIILWFIYDMPVLSPPTALY